MGYFHGFIDGVDYVFVDHSCYHAFAGDIYGGNRLDILFRCALLSKVQFCFPPHPSVVSRSETAIPSRNIVGICIRVPLQRLSGTSAPYLPCTVQAALEAVWHVPCGGVPYGDNNTVFIANDWHTALLPVYLQVTCPPELKPNQTRCVHLQVHCVLAPMLMAISCVRCSDRPTTGSTGR